MHLCPLNSFIFQVCLLTGVHCSFLQVVDVRDSQYLLCVGTAINTSIQNVEAILISRQHWERATSQTDDDSDDGDKKVRSGYGIHYVHRLLSVTVLVYST